MAYFKKMQGRQVYLSPADLDDVVRYTAWMNDADVTDNIGNSDTLIGVDKETAILRDLIKSGFQFAIVRNSDDLLLGAVNLFDIEQVHRCAQCGVFIGDPENRNKGYGGEALRLLLEYAFGKLNLRNVMLTVFAFNKAAVACYEKVGFRLMGVRRMAHYLDGAYCDILYMDILADEFVIS
jgi:RimJ/RimL family protein N-acetyltransferase